MIAARLSVVTHGGDNLIHRGGLDHVRHGMRELAEDELAHQQENDRPTMEMKLRHPRSVAASSRKDQGLSRLICTRILLEFFTSSITKYVCVCCTPRMQAM